ncbi:MAG: methyltransferase domain-containing protein [Elusimicrobiota bacterium]
MNKIKDFFSKRANSWDENHRVNDFITALKVSLIARNPEEKRVLDIGCGTGIMLPFLLARFREVSACDISPDMVRIAAKKYPLAKVRTLDFEKKSFYRDDYFDVIVIYNAFPHFSDSLKVCQRSAALLKKGGLVIIAHSLNRKKLGIIHARAGGVVGNHTLAEDRELREILSLSGFGKIKIAEKEDFILTAFKK